MRFDSIEEREAIRDAIPHGCGELARRVPSAATIGTVYGAAAHMGTNAAPPPGVISTEALADGMPYDSWREQHRSARRDENREFFGIEPKVFV